MKYAIWYSYGFDERDSDMYRIGYAESIPDIKTVLADNHRDGNFRDWDDDEIANLKLGGEAWFVYEQGREGIHIIAIESENDQYDSV